MPIYRVQGPDGKVYRVEGPEGATAEELGAALGAQSSKPATPVAAPAPAAPPAPFQRAGGYGPFMAGVADTGIRAYLGVKTLFGGLSPEEQGVLREQEAESKADPSGWKRTAGRIVGDLSLSAVPASKAAGAVGKVASVLPRALAVPVTAAAVSGAQGLVLNPGEGETWGDQLADKAVSAGKDAIIGGALAGGGQLLKKAATRMFTPSQEAEQLFSQGVNPTLRQGAEGNVGKFIGGLTSGATDVRTRQEREIEDAVMRRITGTAVPNTSRREALGIANDVMEKDYTAFAQGRRVPISPSLRAQAAADANVVTPTGQFVNEATDVNRALGNILPDYGRNINVGYRRLQNDYLHPLAEAAKDQPTERGKQALLRARARLVEARNARLSPQELETLRGIDVRNYDFNRLKEAASGVGLEKEGITLGRLEGAYSQAAPMPGNTTAEELIGPAMRVIGPKPNQTLARSALVGAKRALGGAVALGTAAGNPAAVALAPFYGVSLASQTVPGSKFLMGQYDWQRALADMIDKSAPYFAGSGQIIGE